MNVFKKVNVKDGKPKTCKFCHAEVWWHSIEGRWYNVGGESLHVDSCPLRQEHYKNKALDSAEVRRNR